MKTKQSPAESLITEFYLREEQDEMYQASGFKMTVKVGHHTAAMFTCIANRFGVNRFEVVGPILEKAASEMFMALSPADREVIAKLADEETNRLLENDGVKAVDFITGENTPINSCNWSRAHQYISQNEAGERSK